MACGELRGAVLLGWTVRERGQRSPLWSPSPSRVTWRVGALGLTGRYPPSRAQLADRPSFGNGNRAKEILGVARALRDMRGPVPAQGGFWGHPKMAGNAAVPPHRVFRSPGSPPTPPPRRDHPSFLSAIQRATLRDDPRVPGPSGRARPWPASVSAPLVGEWGLQPGTASRPRGSPPHGGRTNGRTDGRTDGGWQREEGAPCLGKLRTGRCSGGRDPGSAKRGSSERPPRALSRAVPEAP